MEKKKVQLIAESYYSRKDIQQAIYDFCKNRETVPSYMMEAFGKRPDMLDYPSDILNSAKNGATSFHCSEELWSNPLEISKEFSEKQYNDLRIGWDFLIDIDSKYLDYSKIAAKLIIQALEYHDVKNIGIKFSGSKGFHIIIPFKAFPSQVGDELTKETVTAMLAERDIAYQDLTRALLNEDFAVAGESLVVIDFGDKVWSYLQKEIYSVLSRSQAP